MFRLFSSLSVASVVGSQPTLTCETVITPAEEFDFTFTKNDSSAFDSDAVSAPFVHEAGPGIWHMYYAGKRGRGERERLGLATAESASGPWSKADDPLFPSDAGDEHEESTPTLLRGEGAAILREDGLFQMLYSYNKSQIRRATSADGRTWTTLSEPVWHGYSPSALRIDGELFLFYSTGDSNPWTINLARGKDWSSLRDAGVVIAPTQDWEQNRSNRARIFYPSVVHEGTTWTMMYGAYADRSTIGLPTNKKLAAAIGLAHSDDGVTWQKCDGNPVLRPQVGSAFQASYTATPCVVLGGSVPLLYYATRTDPADVPTPDGRNHKYLAIAHSTLAADAVATTVV